MPITRLPMLSTMTTVKLSQLTCSRLNFNRMSTMGTITPRRLTTPLMKGGALAMRVGSSYDRISCTRRMSIPYSSAPSLKARNSRSEVATAASGADPALGWEAVCRFMG